MTRQDVEWLPKLLGREVLPEVIDGYLRKSFLLKSAQEKDDVNLDMIKAPDILNWYWDFTV